MTTPNANHFVSSPAVATDEAAARAARSTAEAGCASDQTDAHKWMSEYGAAVTGGHDCGPRKL